MIVFGDITHARAIAEASGTTFNPDVDRVIARVEDGKLWGGVTYQGYTGQSICIHVAGFRKDWINKDMLFVTFDYPFRQLKCNKLFGQVPSYNTHAIDFDLRIGFSVEAIIRDVYPSGDLVLLSMYCHECKWLKLKPRTIVPGMEAA